VASVEEDLDLLERRLNALRLDYERYFLGTRPREPVMARAEVQKAVLTYSNQSIQNTAQRFKFNSLNSRYQAFKRQWDNILRQMEAGTYKRDIFKANMRERQAAEAREDAAANPAKGRKAKAGGGIPPVGAGEALFDRYVSAAEACGQKISGLTPAKLQAAIDKQSSAMREKLGGRDVNFRVVVEGGRVKLKAGAA
jgi:hypothetical protein